MENKPTNTKSDKSIKILCITLLSIPSIMLYILLWGCVILIACTSLATLLVGICLITTLIPESIIPNIAYGTSLILGISFLGLSILCAIATYYLNCYVVQWSKVYCRWTKNILNNFKYPSLPLNPIFNKKLNTKLKLIAIISLIIFLSTFAIGYFIACATTKHLNLAMFGIGLFNYTYT